MNLNLPEFMVRDLRRMQEFHDSMRELKNFIRLADEACASAELIWIDHGGYWRRILDRDSIESEIVRVTTLEIRDLKLIIRTEFPEFAQHSNLIRDYRGQILGV
jgi:hypothetical protein